MRDRAMQLMTLVENGTLSAKDVLENVLFNYLSSDDANDFAEREYGDWLEGYRPPYC